MDQQSAIENITEACKNVSLQLMKIHPLVPPLDNKVCQTTLYESLYSITKEVETIKKSLLKLNRKDDSTEL